jgi:exodeoxyribonuclease VII large subunit
MHIKTLSVSALNNYIKKSIDSDFILNNLSIKGEISNFKMHSSGHLYFSLKDENSKISCIMFKTYSTSLSFIPKDGEAVVVKGKVSVYEKDGAYQLYCYEMKREGIGELYIAFQELKNKLDRAGLFDISHKRTIPRYPRRIGLVTSPTGAAVKDIINVVSRRNPGVELLIYPSLVQGTNASEDIIAGIKKLNSIDDIDVIILARGGGSIEELWAFNNEKLAYEVYNSKKPIITGIGHETDFTIVDFVGDMRAPTPSAAAEVAVPNLNELYSTLENYKNHLEISIKNTVKRIYNRTDVLKKILQIHSPMNHIIHQYSYIDNLQNKLKFIMTSKLNIRKEKLSKINAVIDAHNPLKVLNKGYALLEDLNGAIISDKEQLRKSDKIFITVKNGKVKAALEYFDEL